MFRLVIAVPTTSHPSESVTSRTRRSEGEERGTGVSISVNAPATDTRGNRMQWRSHTPYPP